ncbi:MAG: ABC transporter permease [Treponema sp.]|nr:ABC transporter permease [Treponema sp.]
MILLKKAFRALWENKKAYIACIVLVCIGIMIYECLGIASVSLLAAKDVYYRDYRLADVFARVKSMPKPDINRLNFMEGISDVLGRQVYDARALMPDSEKIITLRLVSVDTNLTDPLNGILINRGRFFYDMNDIMVNSGFLTAHHLEIGDTIRLVINGVENKFNICAAAQGPDYVSVVREDDPIPDEETFGMAYIQEKTLFALTGNQDIYNDVSLQLKPGFTFDAEKPLLEDALARYGLLELYAKKDQISYATLDKKIGAYVSLSRSLPFVFVFMSIVILYLTLKRIIEMDRTQIGTLKCFGFSGYRLMGHYMIYGGISGFLGGISGCIAGYSLADVFLGFVGGMYHLPNLVRSGVSGYMAGGMLIAVAGGLLGALAGAMNILSLSPAEAMRPPTPKTGKTSIGRLHAIGRFLLNSRGNIAIRSIMRNKMRSLFVVLGIMFSYGLLTLMSSYGSLIDDMLTSQFTKTELYDGKLTFTNPVSYRKGVESVLDLPGITAAEGILEFPAELKYGGLNKDVAITGLKPDAALYKIHDNTRNTDLSAPENGAILSKSLADELGAGTGDTLYVSSLLVSSPIIRNDKKIIVTDIAAESMGENCYMDIDSLAETFGFEPFITSVIFDTNDLASVTNSLRGAKNAAAVQITSSTIENYRQMMAPVSKAMIFMVLMGIVVAFAIIYNTSAISLSEQKREYTTLRVLGLYVGEVAEILKFENWFLCACGMLLGIPFARILTLGISGVIKMDPFTFPTNTPLYAYIVGLAGCMAAVFLSNQSSIQNIKKFGMVEVLKDRE